MGKDLHLPTGKRARQPASQWKHPSWRKALRLILVVLVVWVAIGRDWQPPVNPLDLSLQSITGPLRFDLTSWEIDAVAGKMADIWDRPAAGLTVEQERTAVRAYVALAQRARALEDEIDRVYGDPNGVDPAAATNGRRAELAALRRQLDEQASAVESILQRQLAREVDALDLTTVGLAWPPPQVRLTAPPQLLIVSPRDRIQRLRSVDLDPGLDTETQVAVEQAVTEAHDLSAYVTTIGGYGAWPTMVVNGFGLPWTIETIAHEWVHNYLAFHPLGWSYLAGDDAITLNETVASIVGEEVGRAVVVANYPDLLPPPPTPASETGIPEEVDVADPTAFDFGREMRATRQVVDDLLAQGLVEEAEAFMEARRQLFVEQGYRLRVLNQAYFAFHGSYATGPAATDPIGPKLQKLRVLSPSLADFLRRVDNMTSVEDLDEALRELERDRQAG